MDDKKTLTWDEVRSRSEKKDAGTLACFCGDCFMAFASNYLPCSRHATPEERVEIEELVRRTLRDVRHPLIDKGAIPTSGRFDVTDTKEDSDE